MGALLSDPSCRMTRSLEPTLCSRCFELLRKKTQRERLRLLERVEADCDNLSRLGLEQHATVQVRGIILLLGTIGELACRGKRR